MLRRSALIKAVLTLQQSLQKDGQTRCMCCNTVKANGADWKVAGYLPDNPTHPSFAYALCGTCLESDANLAKAARGIETLARDRAEREATCLSS